MPTNFFHTSKLLANIMSPSVNINSIIHNIFYQLCVLNISHLIRAGLGSTRSCDYCVYRQSALQRTNKTVADKGGQYATICRLDCFKGR